MGTPISDKKNEKKGKATSQPKENWYGFGYLSLFTFIIVLFIGIIGSNFIYLTSLNPEFLDILLPSNETDYFEKSVLKGGGGLVNNVDIDSVSGYSCNIKSNLSSFNKILSILPSKEFPYTMKKKSTLLESFLQKIKNWFVDTTASSFMTSRVTLKMWLKLFSKKNLLGNDTIQMLLVAPLNLTLGSGIAFFVGLVTSAMALYSASELPGFLLGFLFLYNFTFMTGISIIQSILFTFTFLMLPLMLDFKKVLNIMHCNISTLTTLFGVLTCISALFTFDIKSASIYIIAFVLISIITFFTSMF